MTLKAAGTSQNCKSVPAQEEEEKNRKKVLG